MKRILTAVACAVFVVVLLVLPVAMGGFTPREDILKVYNVSEYLGEDVIDEFQEYYKEITGRDIIVQYTTFDENEVMFSKIMMSKTDYDVVCPSDYLIEKMIAAGLLNELAPQGQLGEDLNGNPIEDYRDNISPLLTSKGGYFHYDPEDKYSRAYMWGTMGVLYATGIYDPDPEKEREILEQKGWGVLWDTDFAKRIEMKMSMRDTFVAGAAYAFLNSDSPTFDPARKMTVEEAINNTYDIEPIRQVLLDQKKIVYGYENDNGKSNIILGKTDMLLQWSGDATYAMGDLQEELGYSRDLNYFVPLEGSNLFCDAWVVPKYARNTFAANLWINFMCRPDIAIENMDFTGYTSAVATPEVLEWCQGYYDENDEFVPYTEDDYPIADLSYFFQDGKYTFGDSAKGIYVFDVAYPDLTIIDRCAVMRDYGARTSIMDNLWNSILVG